MAFFHSTVASMVFTCSGSCTLQSFDSRFSLATAVVIVASALPSFFICHA